MQLPSISRRNLLASAVAVAAAGSGADAAQRGTSASDKSTNAPNAAPGSPVAVGSANGLRAVARAVERMRAGADPLDAAIEGVNIVEDDPNDMTVGYGGVPNEDGVVQLDACVVHGPTALAGAVAALEGVKNPTRVAKLVM